MNRFIKGFTYTFHRNLGKEDRVIRAFIATLMLAFWCFGLTTGLTGLILGILAFMLLGTVASARCGVTYWFDTNTMQEQEKQSLKTKGINYE